MNIKDYISSGILEAYVLGELTESEKIEVERNADEYPEVYEEIRHIKEAFHLISVQSLKQAGVLPESHKNSEKDKQKQILDKKTKKIVEVYLKNKFKLTNSLASAAVLLAIISSFAAADLYLKLKDTQDQVEVLISDNNVNIHPASGNDYAAEPDEENHHYLLNKNFKIIELYDLSRTTESHSRIFWNEKTHELFLQVNYLPFPDPGKQYQLWAIIDDKPFNAGLIPRILKEEFFVMKRINKAAAFMITLEPEGGSDYPDYSNEISYRSLKDN